MNKYNPNIHHRKSIRLKGYDYSQAGLFFITICVQDRKCLFGEIVNGAMILNDAGQMVEKWYRELENKYPDKKCHEMVVMPNHFHCIIENVVTVGADLRVCPYDTPNQSIITPTVSGDAPPVSIDAPPVSGKIHQNRIHRNGIHRKMRCLSHPDPDQTIQTVQTVQKRLPAVISNP